MHLTVLRGPVDVGIFELHEGDNVAGRAPDCDVCLPSKRVSRRHCIFSVLNGQVIVRDLGSHNGIVEMGSGRRVEQLRMLPGGRIQLGDFVLTLDAEMTENELQDDDDDVHIATSEIEGGAPLDEDDLDTAEEELSLDDTASAIRAARRPPPAPRPEPPPRRPVAQPVLVRSERRSPPPTPAPSARGGGRLAALAVDEPRHASLVAEEPRRAPPPLVEEARAPRGLPVSPDDPTPRPGPPVVTPRPRPTVVPTPPAAVVPLPGSAADMDVPTSPGGPPPPPISSRPAPRRADPPHSRRTDPLRDTAPPHRLAPAAEVRVGAVPWALQAVGALLLVWSLVVCAPLGGTIALVRGQSAVAHDAAVREAVATATTLAARNAVPLSTGDTTHLDLSLVSGGPGVRDVRVTDAQGAVLAPRDKLRILLSDHDAMRGAMTEGVATAVPTLGGTVEVAAPIRLAADQPVVGYAWVEFSTNRAAAELVNPWLAAFAATLVFGAGIVGSALACWWLVLRPIERLAFGAERMAAGRAQQLPPVPNWEGFERIARALHELAARPAGGGGDHP